MRSEIKYKPVSDKRLAELADVNAPHIAAFVRKRKAAQTDAWFEAKRLEQIVRATRLHGGNVESRYRMPKGSYIELLARQKAACVTCNRPETDLRRRLHVDHNHTTGQVRGLLCAGCNQILGICLENPQTLRHLAAYLEYHAQK